MYAFLLDNAAEIIDRCRAKVARRPHRVAPEEQVAKGVPLFLDQLIRTLAAEREGEDHESLRISGASGGDARALSEIGVSASAYGKVLLGLGFSVDEVVHAYGDLCQAITDLAVERNAPFSVDHFRTLNRCLDNAIADAVAGFVGERDIAIALQGSLDETERLGFLVHEMRNYVHTAMMAHTALETGSLGLRGSTSGLLKKSLASLAALLSDSVSEVRLRAGHFAIGPIPIASLVADAGITASLYARANGCILTAPSVDPSLEVEGSRVLLTAALVNLLQNAFKFTQAHTEVLLTAYAEGDRVLIDVEDHCGGLPMGSADILFRPFKQASADRSGLGLGLSIARRSVEADGGSLSVRDIPGSGCVFTINLPRRNLR